MTFGVPGTAIPGFIVPGEMDPGTPTGPLPTGPSAVFRAGTPYLRWATATPYIS